MRHLKIIAAAGLFLAGCGGVNPPPAAVEPVPIRSDIADQNRFVPPPGGFAGASAAAAASSAPMQAPMQWTMDDQEERGATAGFVPIDGNGFAAEPTAAPPRSTAAAPAASGPNIVEYALSTTHRVGTPRYRRSNPLRWQTWERNCARFPTQDAAQEAFLAAGGPERDRNNLDPDGDGFACWWDPEPFRRAMRAGG